MESKQKLANAAIAIGAVALATSSAAEAQSSDYVNLQNRWKPNQSIHIEQGSIESSPIQPGWHSAQWSLVPVEGTPYVRFQNRWKPEQHIHIENGRIESGPIQPGWWSAQWMKDPVEGTPYVRFQNRWKPEQHIHIENGSIESGPIHTGWHSAQWQETVPANAPPAPVPDVAWNVGAGIYDITGPAADRGMVGYGKEDQTTQGIHTRLWSRAFVVEDPASSTVVAFVSADLQSITTGVHQGVMKKIAADAGLSVLSENNVMLTATHVHVGPGGYDHNVLLNMTAKGYDPAHFETITEGIYQSIKQAYGSRTPGRIKMAEGRLTGAQHQPQSVSVRPKSGCRHLS